MVDTPKNGKLTKSETKKKSIVDGSMGSPEITDLIGQRLRSFYDDASKQPIPDRFMDLLKKLEASSPPTEEK